MMKKGIDIIKSYMVIILDVFVREVRMIRKFYMNKPKRQEVANRYIFMVDGKIPHGGMFDRLKVSSPYMHWLRQQERISEYASIIHSDLASICNQKNMIGR